MIRRDEIVAQQILLSKEIADLKVRLAMADSKFRSLQAEKDLIDREQVKVRKIPEGHGHKQVKDTVSKLMAEYGCTREQAVKMAEILGV